MPQMTIGFLGNAGVSLSTQVDGHDVRVYVDAFFHSAPQVGSAPVLTGGDAEPAAVILATHAHFDHFSPSETIIAARQSGAVVAGPQEVVARLAGLLPADRLAALEPPERKRPYASVTRAFGPVTVTAWRSRHADGGHNSYLVQIGDWRLLHDGDNESTQWHDPAALRPLDALFLCPWQGSRADALVEAASPAHWFLIHLTDDEMDEHASGRFIPEMFPDNPRPPSATGVRPGGKIVL